MASSDNLKIDVINLAFDDALWVLETDLDQLLVLLEDPVGCVSENVSVNGAPAILRQPFVVLFQQTEVLPSDQTILVQGINETAVLTVQYSSKGTVVPDINNLFPTGQKVQVLLQGSKVYTHLELAGLTPAQVANTIFTAATTSEIFLQEFNKLDQTLNGQDVPPASKMAFLPNTTTPMRFVYEGWTPQPAAAGGPPPPQPLDCSILLGDADANGNVIVNNIIIKSYAPVPPGG